MTQLRFLSVLLIILKIEGGGGGGGLGKGRVNESSRVTVSQVFRNDVMNRPIGEHTSHCKNYDEVIWRKTPRKPSMLLKIMPPSDQNFFST